MARTLLKPTSCSSSSGFASSSRLRSPPRGAAHRERATDEDDIDLPAAVRKVLDQYIQVLTTAKDLDDCAAKFVAIAGGNLVNEDGKTLRGGVQPFSLKKDYGNVKFYASPLALTRVKKVKSNGEGYGPSAQRYALHDLDRQEEGCRRHRQLVAPSASRTT